MKEKPTIKKFCIRMPYDLWHFLSIHSIDTDQTANAIYVDVLKQYKNKIEKKLHKSIDNA